MPVGIERINAKRPHPNKSFTFIHSLPGYADSDMALEILEALAAQFRPITEAHHFGVMSLEEYEWNPEFGGRNWNAGERIEIVLRKRDGSFHSTGWLMFVMAHELAHIMHMNHAAGFQKLNTELRVELAKLRATGYRGDGFWGSGKSLTTGRKVGVGVENEDAPTYTCGGAFKKRRARGRKPSSSSGPAKARGLAVKLGTTGRQTAVSRKAGGRVKRAGAFAGEGRSMKDEEEEMVSFKGKKAGAKSAAEIRAAAAEARLAQARGDRKPKLDGGSDYDELEDDEEVEWVKDEMDEEEQKWVDQDRLGWNDDVVTVEKYGSTPVASGSGSRADKMKKRAASPPPPAAIFTNSAPPSKKLRAPAASPSSSPPTKPRGRKTCSTCTLINPAIARACEACETPFI